MIDEDFFAAASGGTYVDEKATTNAMPPLPFVMLHQKSRFQFVVPIHTANEVGRKNPRVLLDALDQRHRC